MTTLAIAAPAHRAALDAAAAVAEELDIPVTMQQLEALVAAVAPHLAAETEPEAPAPVAALREAVDAGPFLRLVHSLIAAGWPPTALAPHMDISQSEFSRLIHRRTITVYMARRIELLFAKLHGVDPRVGGAHQRGITRALNTAAVSGWTVIPAAEAAQIIGSAALAA